MRQRIEAERVAPMLAVTLLCALAMGALVGAAIARLTLFAPTTLEAR